MNCLTTAWSQHEPELRGWARHRLGNAAEADDLLQDLFLKALRQGERFCSVHNARAWLFAVAPVDEPDTVDTLTACLPRVLSELSPEDREAITQCDLQGVPQAEYARQAGLSLSAAKSRVQRARQRLRERMTLACQVTFDDAGKVSDFVPREAV